MNLMNLHQDRVQDIQDFHDQYIAMKKVFRELGLTYGRCKEHVQALLKEKGVTKPSQQQIKNSLEELEEEHPAIMCTRLMDKNTESFWNRWTMTCYNAKTHFQLQ